MQRTTRQVTKRGPQPRKAKRNPKPLVAPIDDGIEELITVEQVGMIFGGVHRATVYRHILDDLPVVHPAPGLSRVSKLAAFEKRRRMIEGGK